MCWSTTPGAYNWLLNYGNKNWTSPIIRPLHILVHQHMFNSCIQHSVLGGSRILFWSCKILVGTQHTQSCMGGLLLYLKISAGFSVLGEWGKQPRLCSVALGTMCTTTSAWAPRDEVFIYKPQIQQVIYSHMCSLLQKCAGMISVSTRVLHIWKWIKHARISLMWLQSGMLESLCIVNSNNQKTSFSSSWDRSGAQASSTRTFLHGCTLLIDAR